MMPLIFLIYIVAYLDRANVGFAKLAMKEDLGFSDQVFGFGFGIFFIGYLFLEIPGALLVERWSARKWFARILITWGICSALTALVRTPMQFYIARFTLGVAEAGFFPGIIVYFTHWFVSADRGRALSGLVMAVPFSLALGAPMSALLLNIHWLGWTGWQWLFVIEGLPAVILGILTFYLLTDRPRDAQWLSPEERSWLEATLAAESQQKATAQPARLSKVLLHPTVWLLALGIFATNTGGYAFAFWLPTAVKGISGGSNNQVLGWSGLIYACGLLAVGLSGWSSDRTQDRKWHCVAGQIATAAFLGLSTLPHQPLWLTLTWLCLTGFSAYFWPSPFWALPTATLTASAAAVAIGFINMCANLAGFLGNTHIGFLQSRGFSDRVCLLFLAACYLAGGVIISCVRVRPPQSIPPPSRGNLVPASVLRD